MAKFKIYEVNETEELCNLGKALASPIRLAMLQLLYEQGMNIGEMAKELDIPASSASFHLNLLEQAGLIRMRSSQVPEDQLNFAIGRWIMLRLI